MTIKRWLYYTVIVGALPLIIRCFMLLFINNASWHMFINPIDFVFLGFTLNLTNINEANSISQDKTQDDESRENITWWSIMFIIFLTLILAGLYLDNFLKDDVLNDKTLKITSILLCIISFFYSLYIVRNYNNNKH